jgi:radical SAM superfamily enzyme YgiQ (UPF0313 family)
MVAPSAGYRIVLTADRTLMADYSLLFDGMLAASLTTMSPPALIGNLVMPPAPTIEGRATVAPLGLRRIEAALLDGGFKRDDVAVVPEDELAQAIGSSTCAVGICAGEPTGHGMNSTTMTGIAGGAIYPKAFFDRLLKTVRGRITAAAPKAKVILGGPGAWQVAGSPERRLELGIDHVVTGYAEGNVADIFRALRVHDPLPSVIPGEGVSAEAIPLIQGGSTMGVVEISRGCGWGCTFCTLGRTPMQHLPEELIIADIETNIRAGNLNVAALSEDFFRYGATGAEVRPQRVLALLQWMRGIRRLGLIQIDHANARSIAGFNDAQLALVRDLLVGDTGADLPWVNMGVETASGGLLRINGGGAKMGTLKNDQWGDFCAEQLRRLMRAGFLPMVSLVIGLPGETPEDVEATLRWVETFNRERITIFPVLYAPVDGSDPLTVPALTPLHWQLIRTAYTQNFRWVPRMYWDNQAAAGVPFWKRMLFQVMGQGQALEWRAFFALHARRARG